MDSANAVLHDSSWEDNLHVIWRADDQIPEEYIREAWWLSLPDSQSRSLDKKVLGLVDKTRLIILTDFLGDESPSVVQ